MIDWQDAAWNEGALDDALVSLARASGLHPHTPAGQGASARAGAASLGDAGARSRFVESLAQASGVEAEAVECSYGELEDVLETAAPALLRLRTSHGAAYLAVLAARRGSLVVLAPSLARVRIPARDVASVLVADLEQELGKRVERWLEVARVGPRRSERARRQLLRDFLGERRVGEMWLLRADPGASLFADLRRSGTVRKGATFIVASLAQAVLTVLGWMVIGRGTLDGSASTAWLTTWILVSLSAIPLSLFAARLGARVGLDVATVLKRRLLAGALRMDPDVIRAQGSGRLLGTVSESSAIETAGLTGAIGALVGVAQLLSAAVVLAMGAGGLVHVAVLLAFCVLVALFVLRLHRRRAAWTQQRLGLTSSFVENVVGNRTRVAQQGEGEWHALEDDLLARYATSSREMDASSAILAVLPSRGWLVAGFLALVPVILAGGVDTARLAVSIGGILQAQAGFAVLAGSATTLLGAHVAWRSIGRLYRAAADVPRGGMPVAVARGDGAADEGGVVLDVRAVSFRYPEGEPVLRSCALTVRAGERVLLEGSSGSGKSTLASVLVGLRSAQSGHVLLRGLDRATLGDVCWRQRVASAPQFHDNHVLSASLSFNLLMGRSWPPSPEDRREAEVVCRELGLGGLLDRMPSGLEQVVGETGWQLSHGERSRVFLARALLQRSEVVVLDETFGALDPLTLRSCLDVVARRAPALVVIAHP